MINDILRKTVVSIVKTAHYDDVEPSSSVMLAEQTAIYFVVFPIT